jgi:hypothetical protein
MSTVAKLTLADWESRTWRLLGEISEAYGETPPGQYAPEVEMAARMLWLALHRELDQAKHAGRVASHVA